MSGAQRQPRTLTDPELINEQKRIWAEATNVRLTSRQRTRLDELAAEQKRRETARSNRQMINALRAASARRAETGP
jgi:hypothetical protein